MNGLALMSPATTRHGSRQLAPPRLDVDMGGYHHYEEGAISPPTGDQKRRRYTNTGSSYIATPTTRGPIVGTPYPMISPYRDTFIRWPGPMTPGMMAPPARPQFPQQVVSPFSQQHHPAQPDLSLTLPPLQTINDPSKKDDLVKREDLLKKEPYLLMIDTLSRVAPPLKLRDAQSQQRRGAVLAVEGDDPAAVAEVAEYLAMSLATEHSVRVAHGPRGPGEGQTATIDDYHALIRDWRRKNSEIIGFATGGGLAALSPSSSATTTAAAAINDDAEMSSPTNSTPTAPRKRQHSISQAQQESQQTLFTKSTPSTSPTAATTTPTTPTTAQNKPPPLLLLNRYSLHAARTYATRVPITDNYSPWDHWKWIASLWRGVVGPDLTVFVRDIGVAAAASKAVVGGAGGGGTAGAAGTAGGTTAQEDTPRPAFKAVEIFPTYRTVVLRRVRSVAPATAASSRTADPDTVEAPANATSAAEEPKREVKARNLVDESSLRRLGFEVGELLRGGVGR